jgi:hypothetical protein
MAGVSVNAIVSWEVQDDHGGSSHQINTYVPTDSIHLRTIAHSIVLAIYPRILMSLGRPGNFPIALSSFQNGSGISRVN